MQEFDDYVKEQYGLNPLEFIAEFPSFSRDIRQAFEAGRKRELGPVPRVLTVRKDNQQHIHVSATQDGMTAHFAIGDPEVQYELLEVIRDDGPREFVLSY